MNANIERFDGMPLIGLIARTSPELKLHEVFSYVAHWYGAQLYVIDPHSPHHRHDAFHGEYLRGLEWVPGVFRRPDVICDRIKEKGNPRYKTLYQAIEGIPTSDRSAGRSLNKQTLYELLRLSDHLAPLVIPYAELTDAEQGLHFIRCKGPAILKPAVGSYGTRIIRIEEAGSEYMISENLYSHRLSKTELTILLQSAAKSGNQFLIQKYISSQTPDGLPFHIRVHTAKCRDGSWQIVSYTPHISVSADKKIVNHRSAFRVFAKWTTFLDYMYTDRTRREAVHQSVERYSLAVAEYMERNLRDLPSEIGIDIGIGANDRIWLYEANINKVGAVAKEMEVAKIVIPTLLAMIKGDRVVPEKVVKEASIRGSLSSTIPGKPKTSVWSIGVYNARDPLRVFPKARIQALVEEAEKRGIRLFFFHAAVIDPESRTITASFLENGNTVLRIVPYPDIVCNESPGLVGSRPDAELTLRKEVMFTTGLIAAKFDVHRQLTPYFGPYLLPTEQYRDPEQLIQRMKDWGALILKPEHGRKGRRISRVGMAYGRYLLHDDNGENWFSAEELEERIAAICGDDAFIIQQYWPVLTEHKEPLDYRIHVQRGRDGRWLVTRIYPRLGLPSSIVSNLSKGGHIPDEEAHWRSLHGELAATRKKELGDLAIAIAKRLNQNVTFMIDELGIDFLMNKQGEIRFLEANTGPESRFHEHARAGNKLDFACYLAECVHNRRMKDKPLVGMMTADGSETRLQEACAYSTYWNNADFYWFRAKDMHPHLPLIKGYTLRGEEWEDSYLPFPDVVLDRFKRRGAATFKTHYERLSHIPFNHNRIGGSFNKMRLYDIVSRAPELRKYLIPYDVLRTTEHLLNFVEKHGRSVIKPCSGTLGKGIVTIELEGKKYQVGDNMNRHLLSTDEMKQLTNGLVGKGEFLIQRFIPTATKDGLPYYIRLHKVRMPDGKWTTAAYVPTISLWSDRVIVNHKSVMEVFANWTLFMENQYPKLSEREKMLREIDRFGERLTNLLEAKIPNFPGEIAIDFALDDEDRIWLMEVNMNLLGVSFREFEVSQIAVPSALALIYPRNMNEGATDLL